MEAQERIPHLIVKMVFPLGCLDNAWMQTSGAESGLLLFLTECSFALGPENLNHGSVELGTTSLLALSLETR